MRNVVFDLDDTLYPEHQFVYSGFRHVAAYLISAGCTEENLYRRMKALFDWGERNAVFDKVLEAAGHRPEPGLIRKLVEIYRTHPPDICLYPDALLVLNRIRRSETVNLGLITDGNVKAQINKVETLGLPSLIEKIVFTDRLGQNEGKPSPKGYLEVQDYFGAPGDTCVYIGDNPHKDFIAAKRLGWTTIRVLRRHKAQPFEPIPDDNEAHFVVSSLFEAASVLDLDGVPAT